MRLYWYIRESPAAVIEMADAVGSTHAIDQSGAAITPEKTLIVATDRGHFL